MRYLLSVEAIVVVAITVTIIAIVCREPLTRRTLEFTPAQRGETFYDYSYDDSSNGGNSRVLSDRSHPLSWTCVLGPSYAWPYCGFGLLFDMRDKGRGLDLSRYDGINLKVDYYGSGKLIRISLKDHDPRYLRLSNPSDKANQAIFPVRDGVQTIALKLEDFTVAEWWKS